MKKYEAYKPTKWEDRIDNAIRLVAPQYHHRRIVARERTNYFRYLAAYSTSARRNTPAMAVGETMRGAREKIQVMWNAVNLIENSGLCSSLLNKFQMYICGTLRWQSRCGDKTIAQEYEDYIKTKTGRGLDATGRYSLRQMCMLDIRGIALKGDIGCNIVRQNSDLYLQGIEGDRIGNPYEWQMTNNYVRGLRLDDTGIIQAVDIFYRDRMSGVFQFDETIPIRDPRGLPRFLFMVNPISYDDYRGVSMFKSAIENATYIDRMREYELQALMWAASQSGVYHTKSGALPEALPFDIAPPIDASGNRIDTYQVRPNTVTAIGVGEDVAMFQHDRPSPNVMGMVKDTIRDICTGFGVSFEFGWDMSGLNGPAVRGVSAQDARAFEVWQHMLMENKLDPIMGLLLGNAIANGELPYHPNWDRWQWFFPAKSTIDAGRESAANIQEIAAGVNSAANVAAESSLDVGEITVQRGAETQAKIEAAMAVADEVGQGITWQEVYQYMYPPMVRGGSRGGGGGFPGGGGGGAGFPTPEADARGVQSDGVDLEGDQSNGQSGNGNRLREKIVLRSGRDGMEIWYAPDQARDEHGRFEYEGKGTVGPKAGMVMSLAQESGDWTPHDVSALVKSHPNWPYNRMLAHMKAHPIQRPPATKETTAVSTESAEEEGKGWKAMYVRDKRIPGQTIRGRMLVSHEPQNKVAIRLMQSHDKGKGYGTSMLDHAIDYAKQQGASHLISDPEGGTKEEAGRLFKKRGGTRVPYKGAQGGYVWQIKLRGGKADEEWFRPDQSRDEHGRFEDEGKGSLEPGYVHPGAEGAAPAQKKTETAPELTGIDKRIADYKPDRSLSDPTKTASITSLVPGTSYVPYSKTPFFDRINRWQRTPDPSAVAIGDYVKARDAIFDKMPVRDVPLDNVVVTQPVVNKDRVAQLQTNPELGGNKPIQVVRSDGKTYILNGHHRVAADVLEGKKTIQAHVYDYVRPPSGPDDLDRYIADEKATPAYKDIGAKLAQVQKESPDDIEQWSLRKNSVNGKLTPEREALHQSIVRDMLNPNAVPAEGKKPFAVLLVGQPGAGKTTAGGDYVKRFGPSTYLNPDDIRARFPEYQGWNAPATQAEAKMVYTDLTNKATAAHQNIVMDETGSNTAKMVAKVNTLSKLGYDVHVVHVGVPLSQSAQSVWERYEESGRFVHPSYLVGQVDHNPDKTYAALKADPGVKSWTSIDNTGWKPRVVDEGER